MLLCFLLAALGACAGDRGEPAADDPGRELRRLLDLDPGRNVHTVTLGGHGEREHVVPPRVRVARDDVVQFVAVDGRIHTVTFLADSVAPEAARFLERTGQIRSPPLLDRDARFVLTFEGAPAGAYPYLSRGPGGEARGEVVVEDSS